MSCYVDMLKFSRLICGVWVDKNSTGNDQNPSARSMKPVAPDLACWSMEAPNKQASTCLGELASQTRPRNTRNGSLRNHNLLGGFNPSEKYESVGMIIPNI